MASTTASAETVDEDDQAQQSHERIRHLFGTSMALLGKPAMFFTCAPDDHDVDCTIAIQQQLCATAYRNPYVLFPIRDQRTWSLYKTIEQRFWSVEDFTTDIDHSKMRTLFRDGQPAYVLKALELHLYFLASCGSLPSLQSLCAQDNTPEGRALFGQHIMRRNLHVEAYSILVNILRRHAATIDGDYAAVQRKTSFACSANPDDDVQHATSVIITDFVFSVATVAAISALHSSTGIRVFEIWRPIVLDLADALTYLLPRVIQNRPASTKLQVAVDLEFDYAQEFYAPSSVGTTMNIEKIMKTFFVYMTRQLTSTTQL